MHQKEPRVGIRTLTAAAMLIGIVFFYFFSVIYYSNSDFIHSPFGYMVLVLIAPYLTVTALIMLPGVFMKESTKTIYSAFLTSLGILVWFTGNFLYFDRGLLDGKNLMRSDSLQYQWFEIVALSFGLLILMVLITRFVKFFRSLVLLLLFMTIGMVGVTLLKDHKSYTITENDFFFRVSSQKNVFVFVFDGFQSDLFQDILDQQPSLAERLDGFTYFYGATGVAHSTQRSLPAMHSGIEYSEGLPLSDHYDEGVHKGSFLAKLINRGYDAAGINFMWGSPAGVRSISAERTVRGFWGAILRDACYLFDISLYRSSPSFLKDLIYARGQWFTTRHFFHHSRAVEDNRFLELVGERFRGSQQIPVARWIHLMNTHPPASVDANCKAIQVTDWNRQTAGNQAACALRFFIRALDEYKKNQIYDNSVILLVADHGQYFSINMRPTVLGRAHPLFLVKPMGAHGRLRHSARNVSVSDIPQTICALTGDCSVEKGISAFSNEPITDRAITYLEYQRRQYSIHGPVDDILSWYRKIPADRVRKHHLDFSRADEIDAFGFGWSDVEKGNNGDFKWAIGPHAQLYLPLKPKVDATVNVNVSTHRRNLHQYVTLYLDNTEVGKIHLPAGYLRTLSFPIRGELVSQPLSRLTFQFEQFNRASPHDSKHLAAAFYELEIIYR